MELTKANHHPKTVALIVAAGSSRRFDGDKLMAMVHQKPLLCYTLESFVATPLISSIILVVPPKREEEFCNLLDSLQIPKLTMMTRVIAGGNTRHESVQSGLAVIDSAVSFVAIHDAARPLITQQQIEHVCKAAYQKGAAAFAFPVTETLHRMNHDGYAQETVDRTQLWSMQTPQVFRRTDLIASLSQERTPISYKKSPTDEVSALLLHGVKTFLVENSQPNLKVTYPADLKMAEVYLRHQS